MNLFRRKPTETELEQIVMQAAVLIRAREIEQNKVATTQDIQLWIANVTDHKKLKKDDKSMLMALAAVQSLLTERTFLDDLMSYMRKHPGEQLPTEFTGKMLKAIEKTVSKFQAQKRT